MATTETQVKTYKRAKDYQHDVKKMAKQGWVVVSSTGDAKRHLLTLPTQQIIVTYQRTR